METLGRGTVAGIESLGYGVSLFVESLSWIVVGRRRGQVVRAAPIFAEAMEVGIRALPIVTLLTFTIGVMLAIQGIDLLRPLRSSEPIEALHEAFRRRVPVLDEDREMAPILNTARAFLDDIDAFIEELD